MNIAGTVSGPVNDLNSRSKRQAARLHSYSSGQKPGNGGGGSRTGSGPR